MSFVAFIGVRFYGAFAANTRHSPGTPFKTCDPRSSNSIPEPTTKSLTVDEASTSPAPASAAMRAPM